MKVPFVDLQTQYRNLSSEINPRLLEALGRCNFILGKNVQAFEEEFAEYCGVKYAVAVSSGTAALFLSLLSLGIGRGDEVITPANTFIATVLAIHYTGARPVLVDIDEKSYNLDIEKTAAAITEKTRAVMPVHLYGQPAGMDELLQLVRERGIKLVEDACQAHGAEYKGKRTGAFGDVSAFSFYPGKNLGAYGDGGCVVTGDAEINEKLLMLRNYGQKEKYSHLIKGYNARLDTIQAEILRVKLQYLDRWNEARRKNAQAYNSLLKPLGGRVLIPETIPDAKHVWHLYVIRTTQRQALQRHLKEAGVDTGIHYPVCVHLQPAFSDLGYKKGDFPVAEKVADEILSLPMYPELEGEQIEYVAQKIKEFF